MKSKKGRMQIVQQTLKMTDMEMGHILMLYILCPEMPNKQNKTYDLKQVWPNNRKGERNEQWYRKRKRRWEKNEGREVVRKWGRDIEVMRILKASKIESKRACRGIRQEN